MALILDIRGTHGSGKSTVVHNLLKQYEHTPIEGFCEYKQKEMVLGYHLHDPYGAVLGRYNNVCGGCDGIGSADETCRRVRLFSQEHSLVILEGILVAHTFQRYSDLAKELEAAGHSYFFLFLNTPLQVCVSRVRQRRIKQGNIKPFNPKNCIHDYHQIWHRTREKMVRAKHKVIELDWSEPMVQVLELVEEEKP